MACEQAETDYCFIQVSIGSALGSRELLESGKQDDDYLIRPEVILAMYQRLPASTSDHPGAIHVLPSHEYLSSTLRILAADHLPETNNYRIHTTFAWLGHGALIRRSMALEFLQLLDVLKASEEEKKMADNYFTILGNRVPEIWLDQGIELGGGQPFSVSSEGHERNARHIVSAISFHKQKSDFHEARGRRELLNISTTSSIASRRRACPRAPNPCHTWT
jgi:hypothetical protein